MARRQFETEAELREFVSSVADDYRDDATNWDTYEAATALYADHNLCPWSITTHLESNVPYDELAGPDPREMLVHEACLCIESLLTEHYADDVD
jgi:hypothetical protein